MRIRVAFGAIGQKSGEAQIVLTMQQATRHLLDGRYMSIACTLSQLGKDSASDVEPLPPWWLRFSGEDTELC